MNKVLSTYLFLQRLKRFIKKKIDIPVNKILFQKIGKNCLVGAGSLVTEGKEFPDGSMIMGSPAKVVRELTPDQIQGLRMSAQNYVLNAQRFQSGLKKIV